MAPSRRWETRTAEPWSMSLGSTWADGGPMGRVRRSAMHHPPRHTHSRGGGVRALRDPAVTPRHRTSPPAGCHLTWPQAARPIRIRPGIYITGAVANTVATPVMVPVSLASGPVPQPPGPLHCLLPPVPAAAAGSIPVPAVQRLAPAKTIPAPPSLPLSAISLTLVPKIWLLLPATTAPGVVVHVLAAVHSPLPGRSFDSIGHLRQAWPWPP
jgi:hypothetical protein